MARSYPMQNSFNAGELSPRLLGRTDIDKYASGAQKIQNFIVQAQGGVKHRSGSRFVQEVKNSANKTKMVPFIVSTVQGYMLEFSNNLIRFYKDEGIIKSGGNPVELVTTYTTAQVAELTFAQTVDALYICHSAHETAKLERTSDIAWTLSNADFQDGPYLAENLTTTTLTPSLATVGTGRTLTASSIVGINGGDGFKLSDVGRLVRLKETGTTPQSGWAEITGFTSTTVVTITINAAFADTVATVLWRLGAFGSATDIGYPSVLVFYEQRLWVGANPGAAQTIYGSVIAEFETFSPTDLDDSAVLDDSGIVYTIAADQANVIRWMDSTRTMILGTSGGIWPVQATTTLEPITPTNIQIKRSDVAGAAAVRPIHVDDVSVYVSSTKRQVLQVGYEGARDTFIAEDLTLLADHISLSGIDEIAYAREPHSIIWAVRNDGVLVACTDVTAQRVFAWHRHVLGGSFGTGAAVVESVAVIPSSAGDPSSVGRSNIPHDQVWIIVKRTINSVTKRYVEILEDDFSDDDVLDDAFYVDSGLTYNSVAATIITGLGHLEAEVVQIIAGGAAHPDRTVVSGQITLNASHTKAHIGLYPNALLDTLNIEPAIRAGSAQGLQKRIHTVTLRFDRTLGGQICSSPNDTPSETFTGTGANTALSPLYRFSLASDLVVTRRVISTGVETTMELTTDYTVTGGAGKSGIITPVDGATDFPTTVKWIIQRTTPVYETLFFRSASDPMDAPPPLFTGDMRLALECGWTRQATVGFRQTQPLPCNLLALVSHVEVSKR